MVDAVKQNFPQREIADAAYTFQAEVDAGERIVVGVNRWRDEGAEQTDLLHIDPALERKQIDRLEGVRSRRTGEDVERTLTELREAAAADRNLMAPLIECARAHASEGEIVLALQDVFGAYVESPIF